ncbi:MAG TPA: FkbM family methyltransferase, partial [Pirellulales bacterium]|nr:FkbM family methyltransferase [Pirellulales bacterium]
CRSGQVNRRLEILKHTIRRCGFGGSIGDWFWNLTAAPCSVLAQRKVRVGQTADFLTLCMPGRADPLFFPKALDIHFLYQTVTEQEYQRNWHCYERFGTTISADDVVFDCGAAEGIFGWRVCEHARQVVVFEPLPEYVDGLKQTFAHRPNVRIEHVALSDQVGETYLQKNGVATCITNEVTAHRIRTTTLDRWVAENNLACTYLKADIEGCELMMLRGAMETLRAQKPKVAITTYHRPDDAQEIAALLKHVWPGYQIKLKGIEQRWGQPMMLHAWA